MPKQKYKNGKKRHAKLCIGFVGGHPAERIWRMRLPKKEEGGISANCSGPHEEQKNRKIPLPITLTIMCTRIMITWWIKKNRCQTLKKMIPIWLTGYEEGVEGLNNFCEKK